MHTHAWNDEWRVLYLQEGTGVITGRTNLPDVFRTNTHVFRHIEYSNASSRGIARESRL